MILFDTETTGLIQPLAAPLKDQPHMIEFAGIKLADKAPFKEIERFETLINPGIPLSEIITKITGLTDKDLEKAPPFATVYPHIAAFFLGERYGIAHNVEFDLGIIHLALLRLGKEKAFPFPPRPICTAELSRSWTGHRLNLAELHAEATGKPHPEAHRAMKDVEALVTCWRWMVKVKRIKL